MSYQLIRESRPFARKVHRCIWCGEPILKGSFYRREISTFDGNLQNHAWHCECDSDAREYFSDGESEFSPYENERPMP